MRLKEELAKLRKENEKYKKSRKMNSSNSSIPPSKDEYKAISNSREKSARNKGGQTGHPAHHSRMNNQPNEVVYKIVAKAPTGAVAVLDADNKVVYYKTQEINAFLKTEITETRYFISNGAEKLSEKEMRKYRINGVSYDDRFKSIILYLNNKGIIALKRLCVMINEMNCGSIDLKASTIVKWEKEFHIKSEAFLSQLIIDLKKEKVLHIDETGWKINGGHGWLHVITGGGKAYFIITRWRGSKEEGPIDILKDYDGIAVHDHYKPYYSLLLCEHAECNAHILRYLKAGVDLDKNQACAEMIKLLQEMIHQRKELIKQGITEMSKEDIEKYEASYHKILNDELDAYAKANPVQPKAKYIPAYIKLMKRMEEYHEEHLRFIKDFDVPADNNNAERQMRPTKAKKKISGQSLSFETANDLAAIHSVIQTCSLQEKNTLEEIKNILQS